MNASFGVGRYFSAKNSSMASPDVFWLNNFQTLYSTFGSYNNLLYSKWFINEWVFILCYIVTLYELMVVNNWHVIMEGFVSTTSWAARIYFILFWVANIVRKIKVVSTLIGLS